MEENPARGALGRPVEELGWPARAGRGLLGWIKRGGGELLGPASLRSWRVTLERGMVNAQAERASSARQEAEPRQRSLGVDPTQR